MDEETFWKLVDAVRLSSGGDEDLFKAELFLQLACLPIEEIRSFDRHRAAADERLKTSKVGEKGLHVVVYEIWGGCSDDSFMDFCSSVIANGRAYYEQMLADPVDTLQSVEPPTFRLRFEAALFGPLYDLEQQLGAPVFGEGAWKPAFPQLALARELLALLSSDEKPALRERFGEILVNGPRWLLALASRWLRVDLGQRLGEVEEPAAASEALELLATNPRESAARRRRYRRLRELREDEALVRYAARRHLDEPWADTWLDLLEAVGGEVARQVFRSLAAVRSEERRLRALSALEKNGDALGITALLRRQVTDASRGEQELPTPKSSYRDAFVVAANIVAGRDPYFDAAFDKIEHDKVERAWRCAAGWLVELSKSEDQRQSSRDVLRAAYSKGRSDAALYLALLGDATGAKDVAKRIPSPPRRARERLQVLKAATILGSALELQETAFESWPAGHRVGIAAARASLARDKAAAIDDLLQLLPEAVLDATIFVDQYIEGLINYDELELALVELWCVRLVLRQHRPDSVSQLESMLRAAIAEDEDRGPHLQLLLASELQS